MPFTLSHAAAALPFRKLKPIWPALVMGTFAPDLQYFVMLSQEDRSGHRFPDLLLFTLPAAMVTLWLFEWIVKGPVIELLPSGIRCRLQDRLEPLPFRGWKQFGLIVLWICVGIATHLVWDQFTHSYSWLPSQWTWLKKSVSVPFVHPMTLTKILQHVSTVLGLAILFVWLLAWYRRTAPLPIADSREFPGLVKVAIVFSMGGARAAYRVSPGYFQIGGSSPADQPANHYCDDLCGSHVRLQRGIVGLRTGFPNRNTLPPRRRTRARRNAPLGLSFPAERMQASEREIALQIVMIMSLSRVG
jgi:hypothetical protein